MSVYRTGNHHGVTIVREGDGSRCGRPGHDCDRGHLVAVVVDGGEELAEQICALLNGAEDVEAHIVGDDEVSPMLEPAPSAETIAGVLAIVDAPYQPGLDVRFEDDL
jgi:hypothetical protein